MASAVGGITDQIQDGVDGLLVHNPADLTEFATVLRRPLSDAALALRLGEAGHVRVRDNSLSIASWAELVRLLRG